MQNVISPPYEYPRSHAHDAEPLLARVRRAIARRMPTPLQLLTLAIISLILLPLAYLVVRALGTGEQGLAYLTSGRTLAVIWNSVVLMAACVAAAAAIGVPFAWLTTRTDLPLRRFWLIAGMLTMVIPSYIGAMMFIEAFGPRGMLQSLLEPLGVVRLPSIYGFFGAWMAITLFTYPYVVLPVRAALLNIDPALEEAARALGHKPWAVFRRVVLPQLRPAMAVGMLLTALYTLSDFGAVALMRYDAFTRVIYLQYTGSFDRSRAAILALMLVLLTIGLLILERRVASSTRGRNYRAGTGCARKPVTVPLGRWKLPAIGFCAALVGIGVFTPIAVLAFWLVRGVNAGIVIDDLTRATLNTVTASGLAALVVGLLALPPAVLAVRSVTSRHHRRLNAWLAQSAYLGNVLPGLVVALAFVFFAANYLPSLYQTLPLLIIGYCARFLPFSIGATRSALLQISPRLDEAARSLGLRPWQVMLRVTTPLARAGILAGVALVFLNAMKELPTVLLLSPTGFDTLPMRIWSANMEARMAQTGAPALLLIAVSALSLILILREERARRR